MPNEKKSNEKKSIENSTKRRSVALITGAAKRIGRQTAKELHQAGFNIIIHYNLSKDAAQELVNELNATRADSANLIQADLTDVQEVNRLGQNSTAIFGRIDVLVNNASSFYPTPVGKVTTEQWQDLMATNLQAPFFLIQSLEKELRRCNGCVINMVDIHAERPLLEYPVYCVAKAGLVMLTKSLSRELAPKIRVNGIAPGAILWHENELTEQDKQQVLDEISLKRLGSPKDIAKAILYLTKADYVTGQILAVDGGRSVNGGEKA